MKLHQIGLIDLDLRREQAWEKNYIDTERKKKTGIKT